MPPNTFPDQQPDPTPEEIRERCAEIQAGWTELEQLRRIGKELSRLRDKDNDHWCPPYVRLQDVDFAQA